MPTLQDDKLDPGQKEYEQNFDFERHERELARMGSNGGDNPLARSGMDPNQSWRRDTRPVPEREAAPNWDMNLSGRPTDGKSGKGGGGGGGRFNPKNMLKNRAKQWIAGGIISMVLTISAAVPAALSGALANLKELSSDWANRNNHSYYSKRTAKHMKKKYFQADADCNSGTKCRFKQGVSDKAIEKFKAAGLDPEIEKAGNKKYIKAFNTTDVEGKKVRVTADAFEQHYGSNVRFRAQMDTVAKPKSMLLRGKQTLKLVFNKFGVLRNRTVEGADDKERTKSFRKSVYGNGNDTEKLMNAPPSEDEDSRRIAGVDDSISEAAQQERDRLESSGFDRAPSIVPDTTNLDLTPDRATAVAGDLVKGGLKGSVLGVFAAIDKACSGYQLVRAVEFGAHIYKVLALVKYAGLFMTIADKLKAGDSNAGEIGYIMGILFKPSTKKDSYGKTFFQSEGFNLISQGKIADQRGLARFTTGSSFLKFIQGAKKAFEAVGATKSSCKHVQSWYGQLSLAVGGLAFSIFSGGTLTVGGVVAGAAVGMIVSALTAYVVPLLIQYAAGTVAPDPTDPEGGYAAGNALAAGMGAFGNFAGRANGERILTREDAAAVEMESNQELAFMEKAENYGKSPFSTDSSSSITSQLALAIAPIAASPFSQTALQSMASIVASPFSLFGSSLGNILTNGASAQSDVDKGGQFCADEGYQEIGIAIDAFCNPIPGEKKEVIDDPKYDPELVDKWMFANGHADPESGEAKSDDFKKYIESCQNTLAPPSPDGGGVETTEDIDTRWCYNTDEKYNYFRFYLTSNAIEPATNASEDGTLGIDEADAEGGDDLTGNTYENGKIPDGDLCALGSAWPGHRLRCDAADAFGALNEAFKQSFGRNIQITDSYRDYAGQVDCYERKPDFCAKPGFSNHGCGQAIDFASNINNEGSAEYKWMVANAGSKGWVHPDWAVNPKPGRHKEPWHWEFGTGGESNNGTCQL